NQEVPNPVPDVDNGIPDAVPESNKEVLNTVPYRGCYRLNPVPRIHEEVLDVVPVLDDDGYQREDSRSDSSERVSHEGDLDGIETIHDQRNYSVRFLVIYYNSAAPHCYRG